ncbi:MAG: AAA family ATPase [Ruminococcaceae bacterium]|nr:AAA family ATPase [Oscillospiraceae bacterium]
MDRSNNYYEECAISYLPVHVGEIVRRSGALVRGSLSEIRLREGSSLTLTSKDKSICVPHRCTDTDITYTVRALCGNSLYSHSETIKEGYICTDGGIRAGVCGRAVTEGGRIVSVTDITSISIRIPHRIPGASDEICKLIMKEGFRGMIIYSPPGVGKTTALREIAARMGSKPYSVRIAVIDTRFEICGGLSGDLTVDRLAGYPRAKGMESALRTMSPQLMICDEIGSLSDSDAIRESYGSGVPTIVSAHARNVSELRKKEYIKDLIDMGAFSYAVGLSRGVGGFELAVTELLKE